MLPPDRTCAAAASPPECNASWHVYRTEEKGGQLSGAGGRGEGGVARLHVDVSAVYLLDFARAPPDTITDSAALSLPEPVYRTFA